MTQEKIAEMEAVITADYNNIAGMVVAIASRFQPRVQDRIEFIRKYVRPAFDKEIPR